MRTEDGTALDGGRIAIHRRCILKRVEHERHCTVAQLLSGRQYSRHGETLGSDVARGAGAARRSVANARTWESTLPAVMAVAGSIGAPATCRALAIQLLQVLNR